MKDFLLKTFKDKKQVFIFVTILLVAFTTFSLLNALLTEEDVDVTDVTDVVDNSPDIPPLHNGNEDTKSEERMIAPLDDDYNIISGWYYTDETTEEEYRTGLWLDDNTFKTSMTTNFKSTSDEVFDVVAVFSGKVTNVGADLFLGNFVKIEHDNGLTTTYFSLGDEIQVEVDDEVEQGDVIGVSGICEVDAENGTQVRLQIKDSEGKYINPETVMGSKISEIN